MKNVRMTVAGPVALLAAGSLALGVSGARADATARPASNGPTCPAGSLGPYRDPIGWGSHVYYCSKQVERPDGHQLAGILWGFDYNPANHHLRAFADMTAFQEPYTTGLAAQPLNLGDRNRVLKSISGSRDYSLSIETAPVGCHTGAGSVYLANLHYRIRWLDGTYSSGQTGQLEQAGSVICR